MQTTSTPATHGRGPSPIRLLIARTLSAISPTSTPGWLRLWSTGTAVLCVVAALLGVSAIGQRSSGLAEVRLAARQLVDTQEARTAVVEADAVAATSFLVGGQESAERRALYGTRLGDAARLISQVARTSSAADGQALTQVNQGLVAFAGLVEQARANNRQAYPVGAAYQRQASANLRSFVLAGLDRVDASSRQRLNEALTRGSTARMLMTLLLLVALGVIITGSLLLARRTRRIINVPLAVALVAILLALVLGAAMLSSSASTTRRTVETSLTRADALSRARTAAFDAKSAESLTLINRGNGVANEQSWQVAYAQAAAAFEDSCDHSGICLGSDWSSYRSEHTLMRAADDGGNWDQAVRFALGQGETFDPNPAKAFAEVVDAAGAAQIEQAADADAGLAEARSPLGLARWLVLIGGLGAAVMAVLGYGQRLKEYR